MPIHTRRERERADRRRLIVDAARELAETEGWDAVTTRRPAAGSAAGRSAPDDSPVRPSRGERPDRAGDGSGSTPDS